MARLATGRLGAVAAVAVYRAGQACCFTMALLALQAAQAISALHPPVQCSYYPVNTVSCCSPALLLENGDAWELERCGCHDRQAGGPTAAAAPAAHVQLSSICRHSVQC